MRILFACLLVLFTHAHTDSDSLSDPELNQINGKITLHSPDECEFSSQLGHKAIADILYGILDREFKAPEYTGASLYEDDDDSTVDCYDFSLSSHHLDPAHLENDHEEIKNRIIEAVNCPDETVEVHDTYDVHSEMLCGRGGDTNHHMNDIFKHMSRRELGITIDTQVDYKSVIGPARDQGQMGSCASFSMDALFQYYEKRDNGRSQEFSPKYFYYNRCENDKQNGGQSPCGSGMVIEWCGELVQMVGNVPESSYPYENYSENDDASDIPSSVKNEGKTLIPDYMTADNKAEDWICFESDSFGEFDDFVLSMKAHLALYGPMVLGVNVYSHQDCDIWNSKNKRKLGGHAMSVLGYDEDGIFIRNSWGPDWCDNGYTHMTWNDAYTRTISFCIWEKPVSESQEMCYDASGWSDQMGATCDDYSSKEWCADCANGPKWSSARRSGSWDEWTSGNCDKSCGCCDGPGLDEITVVAGGGSSTDNINNNNNNDNTNNDNTNNDNTNDNTNNDNTNDNTNNDNTNDNTNNNDNTDANTDTTDNWWDNYHKRTTAKPTQSPSPAPKQDSSCGPDDDSSPTRRLSTYDCVRLGNYCSYGIVSNRCQTTCCGKAAASMELSVGEVEQQIYTEMQGPDYFTNGLAFIFGALFATGAGIVYLRKRKHTDSYVALLENEI